MKRWAGVWEHGQWNLSSKDPCPQSLPTVQFGSPAEAEYDYLEICPEAVFREQNFIYVGNFVSALY